MIATPLRVGVIGLGVGEQHVMAFQAHPDCQVVSVADVDQSKRRMAANNWPGVKIYERPEDLVRDPEINVVCVASPDDAHCEQIVGSIEHGKHVFAEKPLCVTEDQTRRIWEALSRAPQIRLSSNTVLRRSPRFMDLRERIAKNELGAIYLIEADYNYGRLPKLTEGWRGRILDYSVMLGGGVHMVDLALWLTRKRVREVHAYGTGLSSRNTNFRGNDLVVATLVFDDGSLGKISANFGCVEPHFHRLIVYGTAGTFENNRGAATLYRSRDPMDRPEHIDAAYPGVAKGALIPSFVEAIIRGGQPDVDENEVFASMAVCHAIDCSLTRKGPVAVNYFDRLRRERLDA